MQQKSTLNLFNTYNNIWIFKLMQSLLEDDVYYSNVDYKDEQFYKPLN